MEKVIEVKNLYKLYRVGDEVVRALDGVDFNIYKGEFCAIVGTSGSGKSTLLNMLAGLEKPTKGEVIISGEHIEKKNEEELVKFRRDNVGFIFQSFHLLGTMNAVENVALPLSFRGVPKDVRLKKADKMLDLEVAFVIKKKQLGKIIDNCIKINGITVAAQMLDNIKALGFKYSTRGAITVSVSDIEVPKETQIDYAESEEE